MSKRSLISNDRRPYSEPHPEEARNTVAGSMAGDLGFAGGKNERTMKLVSATSNTRRVTSFDMKNYPFFSL